MGVAILSGAVMGVLIAGGAAPLFAYMAEMFPTRLRTSSVSIGYNASVMMFGGTAPFICDIPDRLDGKRCRTEFLSRRSGGRGGAHALLGAYE